MKPRLALVAALAFLLGCAAPPAPDTRADRPARPADLVGEDPPLDATSPAALAELRFTSGGATFAGIGYVAPGAGPHPTAIFLHGFPGFEHNLDLAQAVRRAGWNAVFFHYRGAWGSPGDFSFAHVLEDAAAVVEQVRAPALAAQLRADPARIALVGHSMGGFAALVVGSERADVRCVASLAGANLGLFGRAAQDPAQAKRIEAAFGSWSGPIRGTSGAALVRELVKNADRFDVAARADALAAKPVFLAAGARDDVTPPAQHHRPLTDALLARGAPGFRAIVFETDHAFSDTRVALARALVSWLTEACAP